MALRWETVVAVAVTAAGDGDDNYDDDDVSNRVRSLYQRGHNTNERAPASRHSAACPWAAPERRSREKRELRGQQESKQTKSKLSSERNCNLTIVYDWEIITIMYESQSR